MKKAPTTDYKCLIYLARLEGFEPPAYGLEVRCSIQLSYWRLHVNLVGARGFEPPTPCSQGRCANQTALRPAFISEKSVKFKIYCSVCQYLFR